MGPDGLGSRESAAEDMVVVGLVGSVHESYNDTAGGREHLPFRYVVGSS